MKGGQEDAAADRAAKRAQCLSSLRTQNLSAIVYAREISSFRDYIFFPIAMTFFFNDEILCGTCLSL